MNSICFPGASLPAFRDAARAMGAGRVSFVSFQLFEAGLTAVTEALEGLTIETITHPFNYGIVLTADERVVASERAKLDGVIDAAAALNARSIYLVTGGAGELTWEDAAACFAEAVAPCLARAQDAGIALLVENNAPFYADTNIVHTLHDGLALAEIAGVGLCVDLFACWTESGLRELIRRAVPKIGIIQVCDYVLGDRSMPCRAVPGDGAVPLSRIFGWALEAGYTGAFDIEMIGPRIDREGHAVGVRRAAEHVGELLVSLGA